MSGERFPRREEHERTGGQHGTRDTDEVAPEGGERSDDQPGEEPQLKRTHEKARTSIEDGGARHRTQ